MNPSSLQKAMGTLSRTRGLFAPRVLTPMEREWVRANERAENTGVFACLARESVLVVWHDDSFRLPAGPITARKGNRTTFPPVPWPEIPGAVSASPSGEVHAYLCQRAGITHPHWASLLVGFGTQERQGNKER